MTLFFISCISTFIRFICFVDTPNFVVVLWLNDQLDAQLHCIMVYYYYLYMFRATLLLSSGDQIVLLQHLV